MEYVFRSMFSEQGKPVVGDQAKMLGVRRNGYDIPVTEQNLVCPATGGLSVVPGWRSLPFFLVPARLHKKMPGARGSDRLACFRFGDCEFHDGQLSEELGLRLDSPVHATIDPFREMTLIEFQEALANTQDLWVIDET